MKLKKLQLQGFKSFADRTELNFDRQIAAIVGPNGCGKSNIVDAIRWAMGEQSAKGLRGNDMADVIFAGTPTRKPGNVAEVSLVFDNQDRLAPPPYTEVNEIMVTRRLFRSGESEYLINRVVVRLKDVNDLFLGTGSSAKAYSIVAQGKVDQVVLAKPEDRRFLIEEAAGVAKYKVRKQSAERKMDATKHNLERVQDILQELEKNARHLERQVEKAEKFREIQRELRQVDEKLVRLKVTKIDELAALNESNLQKTQDEFQGSSTQLLERESSLEALRLQILNLEKRLSSEIEALMRRRDEGARFEMDAELSQQRMNMLSHQIEERKKDIERLQAKHRDQEGAKEELDLERQRLEEEKSRQEQEAEARKQELAQVEAQITSLKADIQVAQSEIEALRAEAAKRKERAEILKSERVNQELKHAELESLSESLAAENTRLQGVIESLQSEEEKARGLREDQSEHLKSARLRQEELSTLQGQLFEKKSEIQAKLSEARSSSEAIDTLEQHQVGYDLSALEYKNQSGQSFVLELLSLRSDTQNLGEKIFFQLGQYFVSSADSQSSQEGFARHSRILARGETQSYPRSAMDLVAEIRDEGLRAFLHSIEWVDQVSDQSHACFDATGRLHLPLSDGFVLSQEGDIRRDQSPFSRRAEAEKLGQVVLESEQELGAVEGEILRVQQQIQEVRLHIRDLEQQIQQSDRSLSEKRAQVLLESGRKAKVEARSEENQSELSRLQQKIKDLEEQIRAIPSDETVAINQTQLENLKAQLRNSEAQKASLDSSWVEFRIELGALLERLDRLRERSVQAEMAQNEYQHNEGIYRQDIQTWSEEIERLRAKAENCRNDQNQAREEALRLESSVAHVKEELARLQTKVDEDELERRAFQLSKDELQKKLQEFELERQNLKFQVEELGQIIHERYQISLSDFVKELQESQQQEMATEESSGTQVSSDPQELEERSKYLRERIAKFGDVNLVALQEYEEIKTRLEFMTLQRTDLTQTLDSLQSIIDRINKITEFRFRETFRAINHNFQILFPKLFGGGKAYMSLTNEHNLLEAGVEIFAEPPGKKIQAMSLLSGGEKAMTSISLLFSLFSYRPSSFCILDEVDAPLDDINTRRYNEIIREMSGLSQFIVITHNKRTMEVAETLFGVTMQEPGASKLVGVNLQEARSFSATIPGLTNAEAS